MDLAERLSEIQGEVDAEVQAREAAYERITNQWSDGLNTFYQQLTEESKQWETYKESLLQSIEAMTDTIRSELEKERKEREAIEERLIGLLEETCYRVEQGPSYNPFL